MFSHRIRLFKLYGFQVWLDWSWLLLAVLLSWSLRAAIFPSMVAGQSDAVYWAMGVLGTVGMFLSIVLHEFAHSVVARNRGLPMSGITLFIFGGIAEMSDEPPNPATEFWMAVAGPATSVLIGVVSLIAWLLLAQGGFAIAGAVCKWLGLINLTLAVFNMVPAFPLDGGRVLRSVIWHFKGDLPASTKIAAGIGTAFAFLLMILGVLEFFTNAFVDGIWLVLIGLFLKNASESSYRQVLIRKALEGEKVRRFMNVHPVVVPAHITVREFVNTYVTHNYHKSYPVQDEGTVVGIVTVDTVREMEAEDREFKTMIQIAEPPSAKNTISADDDAMKALEMMNRTQRTLLLVIEHDTLLGIVTLRDVAGLLTVKLDFQQRPTGEVVPPPVLRTRP